MGSPSARLLRQPRNLGKGAAVRAGVRAARAGGWSSPMRTLAIDPRQLPALLAALDEAPVAVGTRASAGHVDYGSWLRTRAGRSFNLLVRLLSQHRAARHPVRLQGRPHRRGQDPLPLHHDRRLRLRRRAALASEGPGLGGGRGPGGLARRAGQPRRRRSPLPGDALRPRPGQAPQLVAAASPRLARDRRRRASGARRRMRRQLPRGRTRLGGTRTAAWSCSPRSTPPPRPRRPSSGSRPCSAPARCAR